MDEAERAPAYRETVLRKPDGSISHISLALFIPESSAACLNPHSLPMRVEAMGRQRFGAIEKKMIHPTSQWG